MLRYVGGTISPEMQTPKLLWLAENMPDTFANAWQFMDLTDFLTWKSSGSIARSVCTVTCKWTYLAHERRWDPSYFEGIGLGSLVEEGFARIGTEIVDAGTPLGNGLTAEAASELGLPEGIAVGAGLIDAHAGGIGTVGATGSGNIQTRMAYVFGTSACTTSTTSEPAFVDGVWGPYYSAMAPGLWLNEGGQSAAGAAIDHLVRHHPAACEAAARASECKMNLTQWLAVEAAELGGASRLPHFVGSLHVAPEFLGNRASFADPNARAVIAGLGIGVRPRQPRRTVSGGRLRTWLRTSADSGRPGRERHLDRHRRRKWWRWTRSYSPTRPCRRHRDGHHLLDVPGTSSVGDGDSGGGLRRPLSFGLRGNVKHVDSWRGAPSKQGRCRVAWAAIRGLQTAAAGR